MVVLIDTMLHVSIIDICHVSVWIRINHLDCESYSWNVMVTLSVEPEQYVSQTVKTWLC